MNGHPSSYQFRNAGFVGMRRKILERSLSPRRNFSFISDFLTVKEKYSDFFLHKKICNPNESTIYRDFI